MLWSVLQKRQGFFKDYTLPAAATDFLLHCCAILFSITVYAGAPQVLLGLLLLPTIATLLQGVAKSEQSIPDKVASNGKPAETKDEEKSDLNPLPVKPFITTYRGAMMIITCCSILAVDFPVFPRRFAKTESFGTSLMDMGVGSFVFAAGIVAARQQLKEEISGRPSFDERMKTALRHSVPLLALGLARLWSVKGLDYAEHVSEYGVHWNFFFTLGLLPITFAVFQPVLRFTPSYGVLAFVLAICYELVLYIPAGMKAYIILSERKPGDWMSQNREGVFSLAGYFCIFLGGIGMGTGILPRDPDPKAKPPPPEKDSLDEDAEWLASVIGDAKPAEQKPVAALDLSGIKDSQLPKTAWVHLIKWNVLWFVFSLWAMWRYGPRLFVSRRMANLAYIVWVCSFNSFQLLCFYGVEAMMFPNLYKAKTAANEKLRVKEATSAVMKAFNRNGLAIFLMANLLTGGINMSMDTIRMGEVEAMTVLVGYMAVLCGTALALDRFDVSIKL